MVNKKMKPARLLRLIRRSARQAGLRVVESPLRGKGSHQLFELYDSDKQLVGRFILTGHNREISWKVLRDIERRLTPLFGDNWMEE